MWYVPSLVAMSISQPSPDRLIFYPERRSTLLTGLGYIGLVALAHRNEAKYLQQLTKQDLDSI
jgi:hypothetical protein